VKTTQSKSFFRFAWLSVVLASGLLGCATPHTTESKGMTGYLAYDGKQDNWPRNSSSLTKVDFAVPAYLGLPPKPYRILGFVVNTAPSLGAQAALPEWMWSDETRMANAANQAKEHGGDAIMVTNDPKVVQVFKTLAAGSESTRLLVNSDAEIVVIKWTK
jgi:hypothetical protein